MAVRDQLERLGTNLLGLGTRRLIALAVVGVTVFAAVAFGSYYLSRPQYEVLYVGLSQQDASRIGGALRDAGIAFDISSDGTRVMVPNGQTARARMLLAEKGLPTSVSSGYELFDKLGPVGLTSFMQDITRVRALEGEIGRTIQTMRGVKAARVHLVLPDIGSFRRARQAPSASVVIATDGADSLPSAAVRHLVSAAVPGLTPDQVTVLSTDGQVLAAGGETLDTAPHKLVDLEKAVNADVQENVRKTLIPHLGFNNFEVSVAARLNTDKRQVNETIFDPESQIARSVRNVRENSRATNDGSRATVTVEQNVPGEATGALPGDRSSRQNDRREELTNYELNSKVVATVSSGYRIENLTVAVVVNRRQLLASLGENPSAEAVDRQIKELERLVETAAGVDTKRGDRVTIAALDFTASSTAIPASPEPGILDAVSRHSGTLINAAAIVIAAFLLVWFGLRPAVQAILDQRGDKVAERPPLAIENAAGEARETAPELRAPEPQHVIPREATAPPQTIQQRLEETVEQQEAHAAALLKQWIKAS